ncbi:mitochondrial disaggregase-like isoform X4 [Daphnia carinata]|uniref:mitochondrial disaggregase-like isoform X4 n=1 Tax=Daphnia carinata TaxID=120202 RepID=UPI00257FDF1F|nr:mitochondrial disaggregase-like isoform X4 [Daphnia carinata]
MQNFQNALRVFRYLPKTKSFQLFWCQRQSTWLPYSFSISSFSRQTFNHNSRSRENSPKRKFGALPFMAFGIVIAHCAKQEDDKLVSKPYEHPLFKAARKGNAVTVERLCRNGADPNQRHPLGWTPLHIAAVQGNVDVVKTLLKCGANSDLGDDFSNANLKAREKGLIWLDVMEMREEEFSDRLNNRATFTGCTALHYACIIDDAACVAALLEGGCNPSLPNLSGHKPIDYANSDAMKKLLESYIAKYEDLMKEKAAEERRRYPLELRLKEKIIGQEAAIATVASAIRRKEGGWIDEEHPLVFLFLGSSGIGKTELAKQVATYLNPKNTDGFIRLDMSEYQNKHEVAKLIGSPPGYVGYEEGGQLTKKLKKCPDAVVLLDEVDKAHPDVLTVLLQLFDEGRITDGRGKTTICKDAIFIMTSNLANDEIADHALRLRHEAEMASKRRANNNKEDEIPSTTLSISREFSDFVVRPILKRHFGRDEFLGRINEFVFFFPFSRTELHQLVQRELDFWAKKAKDRYEVDVSWDGQVLDALCLGYNVAYGARSIKYEVERNVVSLLSNSQQFYGFPRGALLQLYVSYGDGSSSETARQPEIRLRIKTKDSVEFTELASPVRDLLSKADNGKGSLQKNVDS